MRTVQKTLEITVSVISRVLHLVTEIRKMSKTLQRYPVPFFYHPRKDNGAYQNET